MSAPKDEFRERIVAPTLLDNAILEISIAVLSNVTDPPM
jgi:hypothetical protein